MNRNCILISFVVDKDPKFYYQAEMLLFSLMNFTNQKKENIQVQCVRGVDKEFIAYLEENKYRYNYIEPFIDGKYCNKLRQLDVFINLVDKKFDGVILLDTDMFFLDSIRIQNKDVFCAKVVDLPNPPLEILQKIYTKANVNHPEIVNTDCVVDNGRTFKSNFNGGFYYIPKQFLLAIKKTWIEWAIWLFNDIELLEKKQRIHIDQISMSLAIESLNIPYLVLDSNLNYPYHLGAYDKHYFKNYPIKIIHYHCLLNSFGLLYQYNTNCRTLKESIEKSNNAIITKNNFRFKYKIKNLHKKGNYQKNNIMLDEIILRQNHIKQRKIKIIIHAGTPKTGSTSLQFYLKENQKILCDNGIVYCGFNKNTYSPKHQWLVPAMMNGNEKYFADSFLPIMLKIDDSTHTIILSTEGIFNHWQDFTEEGKSFLFTLQKYFQTELWIWFRDPITFAESYYIQNIKNHQIKVMPCYGRNLSLGRMLLDEWFLKHFDYLGFINSTKVYFDDVRVFEYKKDGVIYDFVNALGVDLKIEENLKENTRLGLISIYIIRLLNMFNFSRKKKSKIVRYISKYDKYLLPFIKYKCSKRVKNKIIWLFENQKDVLKKDYGIFK